MPLFVGVLWAGSCFVLHHDLMIGNVAICHFCATSTDGGPSFEIESRSEKPLT